MSGLEETRYFVFYHLARRIHDALITTSSTFREGILERHFYSGFLGINLSLLRLEFFLVFCPNFFLQNAIQEYTVPKFSFFADYCE
jgi:hypothetical protein